MRLEISIMIFVLGVLKSDEKRNNIGLNFYNQKEDYGRKAKDRWTRC